MKEKYYIIACHVLWREICHHASVSKNIFYIKFLRQGLHNTPEILRKELQQAIDAVDGEYPVILIGYGLCSNGIEGISAKKSKLVIMRGHDCITFFLGSKSRYKSYFDEHPGTYWYTPGWIDTGTQPGKERYENLLQSYIEKYGEENAEYLMEMEQGWFKEYNNAAYIDTGVVDGTDYKNYTKECTEWLNWNYDELVGDSGLLKDFLEGNWDSERFLVAEPGQKIKASHDDNIIHAE